MDFSGFSSNTLFSAKSFGVGCLQRAPKSARHLQYKGAEKAMASPQVTAKSALQPIAEVFFTGHLFVGWLTTHAGNSPFVSSVLALVSSSTNPPYVGSLHNHARITTERASA